MNKIARLLMDYNISRNKLNFSHSIENNLFLQFLFNENKRIIVNMNKRGSPGLSGGQTRGEKKIVILHKRSFSKIK